MDIAWLLAKTAVSSVILGASKSRQLAENLAAADLVLGEEEIAELDAAMPLALAYPNWAIDNTRDAAVTNALNGTQGRSAPDSAS